MRLAGSKRGIWPMPEPRVKSGCDTLVPQFAPAAAGECASRRAFLALAAIAASGTARTQTPPQAVDRPLPQIGILLATTYTTGTLESRLEEAKLHGLTCVQMSMTAAGLPAMPDEIPSGLPARIQREAAARGIRIGSVQGTFNMCHPDPEHRLIGLRRLRVLAEAFPRMAIHICTGTRDPNSMWRRHPENNSPQAWRDMAACIREASDIARQSQAVLAFEPEVNNIVHSARKARQLLDEIGSPHLKVTLDPANLFPAGTLPRMKEILEEAFALVGKEIVLAHAKDLDHDGDAGHKAAGEGQLDYDLYMRLLHAQRFAGALLLHGLSRAQVPGCVAFLRAKLARLGREWSGALLADTSCRDALYSWPNPIVRLLRSQEVIPGAPHTYHHAHLQEPRGAIHLRPCRLALSALPPRKSPGIHADLPRRLLLGKAERCSLSH